MNTGFKCIDTKPVVSFGVFFSAFLGLKCHYLRKKRKMSLISAL